MGGSNGSTTASTIAGLFDGERRLEGGPHLVGRLAAEADAAARLGELDEVDRLELDPYSGLPRKTICSHLIWPSVLFLMMTTLIGSLCLTAVTNSPISIVNPPSPTKATTWRSG